MVEFSDKERKTGVWRSFVGSLSQFLIPRGWYSNKDFKEKGTSFTFCDL